MVLFVKTEVSQFATNHTVLSKNKESLVAFYLVTWFCYRLPVNKMATEYTSFYNIIKL